MTTKAERAILFEKYDGKCAYCGEVLTKSWHVDHLVPVVRDIKTGKPEFPERDCIENKNPSCASCNINKNSMSLEGFRAWIKQYVQSLNKYNTQYKIAKRFGLIKETEMPVVFYFETIDK